MDLIIVDAFAESPFSGNPAAVCLMEARADDAWMKNLAAEMNLSETAFVQRGGKAFGLRWFTPCREVTLCGHATLASAHVLWENGILAPDEPALFESLSGQLVARREDNCIVLDFPSLHAEPCQAPPGLAEALECRIISTHANSLDVLVCVASADEVRRASPDMRAIRAIPKRGVILTAESDDPRFDFISRYFAPAAGVDEDPVTGSAHCCLAPFWAERLGKQELTGYQASSRGGIVRVRARGDRVDLIGRAVTVLRGRLAEAARFGPGSLTA